MIEAARQFFSRLTGRKDTVDRVEFESRAPKFGGSGLVLMGPPRSGKTFAGTDLVFVSGCTYGLPMYIQDTTGSVEKTARGYVEWLNARGDANSLRHAEHIEKRAVYFGGRNMGEIFDVMEALVKKGSPDHWQGVFLFDDARVLREMNPDAFNKIIPLSGNVGAWNIFTAHRGIDIPPAARATIRIVVPYKSPVPMQLAEGLEYPEEILNDHQSNVLKFVEPSTGKRGVWDMSQPPPAELITPAVITKAKPTAIHIARGPAIS